MASMKEPGPPYAPQTASLGGEPTTTLDVPITAVFLFLFICGAVGNMTIFQLNNRRGHKFVISGMLFGFCMARITTMSLRIAWSQYPRDVPLAIAAQILVAAGVVLLYIINLLFAQRLVRAAHPRFGWHRAVSGAFIALYAFVVIALMMVITVTVWSFYTLDEHKKHIFRRIQLGCQTYYAVVAFLPIPMVIFGLLVPRKTRLEKFGSGRWRTKVAVLLTAATLLSLGVDFRVGINYLPLRPRSDPAWYDSKPCFYIFNFTVEILVVYLYIIVRVDRRFHIPNGSHGPGDYLRQSHSATDQDAPEAIGQSTFRVTSEEETFDDKEPDTEDREKDLEAGNSR